MNVPDSLQLTESGARFLEVQEPILDKYGTQKKILIFCSQNQLEMLSRADSWIGDCTFDVVSWSLFYQLFIIIVRMRNCVHLPALFAYLQNKELASYDQVFAFRVAQGISVSSIGFH